MIPFDPLIAQMELNLSLHETYLCNVCMTLCCHVFVVCDGMSIHFGPCFLILPLFKRGDEPELEILFCNFASFPNDKFSDNMWMAGHCISDESIQ